MPILTADLLVKLSTKVGAAGNSTAGTPTGSLGKYVSTTVMVDNTLSNLFDTITGDENAAGDIEYRCIFLHNAHATLTLIDPKVWVLAPAPEDDVGAEAALAVDSVAASALGAAAAQALEVADENTAPAALSFSAPTTKGTGLSLGDIGPGQVKAVWIRRTADSSPAINDDLVQFRFEGDTAA